MVNNIVLPAPGALALVVRRGGVNDAGGREQARPRQEGQATMFDHAAPEDSGGAGACCPNFSNCSRHQAALRVQRAAVM